MIKMFKHRFIIRNPAVNPFYKLKLERQRLKNANYGMIGYRPSYRPGGFGLAGRYKMFGGRFGKSLGLKLGQILTDIQIVAKQIARGKKQKTFSSNYSYAPTYNHGGWSSGPGHSSGPSHSHSHGHTTHSHSGPSYVTSSSSHGPSISHGHSHGYSSSPHLHSGGYAPSYGGSYTVGSHSHGHSLGSHSHVHSSGPSYGPSLSGGVKTSETEWSNSPFGSGDHGTSYGAPVSVSSSGGHGVSDGAPVSSSGGYSSGGHVSTSYGAPTSSSGGYSSGPHVSTSSSGGYSSSSGKK